MNGIEAHFTGRLGKDGELRQTKAGKPMAVLQVAVDAKEGDAWCTVLAFEELAAAVAGLAKGAHVYAKGTLKVDLYTPQGGEPRVSLTLLANAIQPLVLERKAKPKRQAVAVVEGDFDDPLP